jgi:hypothetical protein
MTTSQTPARRFGNGMRHAVAAALLAGGTLVGMATSIALPIAGAQPPTAPMDGRGYLDSPTRCAPDQTAVLVGRTALSLVAICTDSRGHYQYRGMRLSDRAVLTLPAVPMSNGCFGARSDTVNFTLSDRKLLLTSGARVLRDEPMLDVRDYRMPAVAPVTQQAGFPQSH